MAWLSAVKLDEGVRLQGKSPTFPLVLEVIAFPSGSKSTGGTQEPLRVFQREYHAK